jgi:hypothetical protein
MTLHIGMLLFPRLTQLDLTGPFEILHRKSSAGTRAGGGSAASGARPAA